MTDSKMYWCARCNKQHVRIHQAVPDKPAGYKSQLFADFAVALLFMAAVFTSLLWAGTR